MKLHKMNETKCIWVSKPMRIIVLATALNVLIGGGVKSIAAEENAGKLNNARLQYPNPTPKASEQKSNEALEELTLNDLDDLSILLNFISEQSINLYQETVREPVSIDSDPDRKSLTSIPLATLKEGGYLPARIQWLVFYFSTMEPVVRELIKQTHDIETGSSKFIIPASMQAELTPLWQRWTAANGNINKHLDEFASLLDENPVKVSAVREKSAAIYNDVLSLNDLRRKIFVYLREQKKAGNRDRVLMSP